MYLCIHYICSTKVEDMTVLQKHWTRKEFCDKSSLLEIMMTIKIYKGIQKTPNTRFKFSTELMLNWGKGIAINHFLSLHPYMWVCVRVCVCYLMKARVLNMVGRHLFLSLDLHADLKTNCSRHRRLVCSLFFKDAHTQTKTQKHKKQTQCSYTIHTSVRYELGMNFQSKTTTLKGSEMLR